MYAKYFMLPLLTVISDCFIAGRASIAGLAATECCYASLFLSSVHRRPGLKRCFDVARYARNAIKFSFSEIN